MVKSTIPQKLKPGDEVRIISPAVSLGIKKRSKIKLAKRIIEEMGLKVTFSAHAAETDEFWSSKIESRISDMHAAFKDKKVKAIITTTGGYNANQLLKYIDYDIIRRNPKILCGYSDITALSNAIYAKTGLVGYSGPNFTTFAHPKGLDYTRDYFKKCLLQDEPYEIKASKHWSDWHGKKTDLVKNKGWIMLNKGKAKGTIIGGNLCTLNLLQGTEFMPSLKNSILFIEDDHESMYHTFDRDLQSLLHLPDFKHVKALIIGRFQFASKMKEKTLLKIIKTKKELDNIPIIANVDFGHTSPQITFPVGGMAEIKAGRDRNDSYIKIIKH